MKTINLLFSGFALIAACTSQAAVISVSVPGTSDMWLAGMPDGSTASSGDTAPAHSPVLVIGLDLSVDFLTFNATGGVLHQGGCPPSCNTPDGGTFFNHSPGALNGISDVRAPINSLLGVFLNDSQPDSSAAPATLNFETLGTDFASFVPELKQVFFIGDGLTGDGVGELQEFLIPTGATRLFLGTMDGFGWFNNTGAFDVDVTAVPVPAAIWLFGSGLIGLAGIRKSKANRQ